VLTYARLHSMVLVTGDLGFSNVTHYPIGSHSGIVVARFPNEVSTELLNRSIVDALSNLLAQGLTGALAIIEPGKVRLRKP
jgi:hypothetical protein